jgi:hypothetical protein
MLYAMNNSALIYSKIEVLLMTAMLNETCLQS